MPKLISEQVESELRSRIPSMAKNVHEGILSGIANVGRGLVDAGKKMVSIELQRGAQRSLDRQKHIQDNILGSHYADKMGVSMKEFKRVRDEVSSTPPTAPLLRIPDPNHTGPGPAPDIANPNYAAQHDIYTNKLDDYYRKVHQQNMVAGINKTNRTIGRAAERLEGRPGRTKGLIDIFKSRL
jgi:hypothetical protein